LEQDAAKWKWKEENENLLWQLTKDPQRQFAALAALTQYYGEKGDTGQLYRAVARLCELKPNDQQAQNNLANLSLLLNLSVESAHGMAEQLYRKAPENPVFASTYAFSLYRKGKYAQAVATMSKLKASDLDQPAMAAYYGIFLAAAGDNSKAQIYLDKAQRGRLLPEEKALVDRARVSVAPAAAR
jgi:predicted Zn-dependent protease